MTYVDPKTMGAEALVSTDWNTYVRDNLRFLHDPPSVQVFNSADQSIPDATWTALAFDSEVWDTDTMHDPASNNTRLTCKTAGKFRLEGCVSFEISGVGWRGAKFRLNGTTDLPGGFLVPVGDSTYAPILSPHWSQALSVGDYIEMLVYQDSGGAIDSVLFAGFSPRFAAAWFSG